MTRKDDVPDGRTLKVKDVCKEYASAGGTLVVLRNVSFEVPPGETVAVVGPSGSGKSTLLNIIGSLDKPTAGRVLLGDLEVTRLEGDALATYRSQKVGFIFQDHHLLPQCTALENVVLPTLAAGHDPSALGRAEDLLKRVGLAGRLHALPAKLSGGERQRVAIARAMINNPPLLLCDEPTGNLDRDTSNEVAGVFARLADDERACLVVVTHNLDLAKRFARVLELRNGELKEISL
ncbi:MAG TPA: ABC transporter ATP-binding protein [Planctomycetota bacterium]|nr:ABC transporter ATP-binding protein [Planctomycetota bacterium]HUV38802.1 ABC transporter ATP-binding protein [Planctomycetota bacterium]